MKTQWMLAGLVALCGMAQAAFVTIGHAGNAADTTGYGAVGYTYRISAIEVTIAEFTASGAGNGNENYWNDGTRIVGTNAPASMVTLYEAMKYCNWLTTGDINNGLYEDKGGGVWGAKFDRATVMAGGVNYFAVPTEDEWYKAAYYTSDSGDLWSIFANGTDTVPKWGRSGPDGWNYYDGRMVNDAPNFTWTVGYGGEEQNGTYDMMGNVWELMENNMTRGGGFNSNESYLRSANRYNAPSFESPNDGFRVVAIPEPASAMLVFFGAGVGLAVHRARRTAMRR